MFRSLPKHPFHLCKGFRIVRCDLIAEGVIAAIEEVGVEIPVVVRLEGNNADLGSEILSEAGIKIESINNLGDAAKKAVELAK